LENTSPQTTVTPRSIHLVMQHGTQVVVEAAQDLLPAIDERGLDAQPVEDRGELAGDVAAAGDHDASRQRLEVEGSVGGDDMLDAGQLRVPVGPASGRDQDGAGGDVALLRDQPDRMGLRSVRRDCR
jgi:hypothetical protein